MTEIYCMTQKHKYWNKTICLAERCSWASRSLFGRAKMKNNDFAAWERVFACLCRWKSGRILYIC